jgi:hypothetical protein
MDEVHETSQKFVQFFNDQIVVLETSQRELDFEIEIVATKRADLRKIIKEYEKKKIAIEAEREGLVRLCDKFLGARQSTSGSKRSHREISSSSSSSDGDWYVARGSGSKSGSAKEISQVAAEPIKFPLQKKNARKRMQKRARALESDSLADSDSESQDLQTAAASECDDALPVLVSPKRTIKQRIAETLKRATPAEKTKEIYVDVYLRGTKHGYMVHFDDPNLERFSQYVSVENSSMGLNELEGFAFIMKALSQIRIEQTDSYYFYIYTVWENIAKTFKHKNFARKWATNGWVCANGSPPQNCEKIKEIWPLARDLDQYYEFCVKKLSVMPDGYHAAVEKFGL